MMSRGRGLLRLLHPGKNMFCLISTFPLSTHTFLPRHFFYWVANRITWSPRLPATHSCLRKTLKSSLFSTIMGGKPKMPDTAQGTEVRGNIRSLTSEPPNKIHSSVSLFFFFISNVKRQHTLGALQVSSLAQAAWPPAAP